MSLETALIASACIVGGCAIGLLCRIRTDFQIWQARRRRMQHRKLSFKRPYDRGDVLPDLIVISVIVALALAISYHLAIK